MRFDFRLVSSDLIKLLIMKNKDMGKELRMRCIGTASGRGQQRDALSVADMYVV